MRISAAFTFSLLLVGFAGLATSAAHGQQLTTLYDFCSQGGALCTDGSAPEGYLIQGSDGYFYGTTMSGGTGQQGTVFKMSSSGGPPIWVYSFCSGGGNCTDGAQPYAGVIEGSDGNFYGTTVGGGIRESGDQCPYGTNATCGTVFKITPQGELTTVYSFCSQLLQLGGNNYCADGANPYGGLALSSDALGNEIFFGTTITGGAGGGANINFGTVFQLAQTGGLTTLYNFCSQTAQCLDGWGPGAGLVLGSDGNLYGSTAMGGNAGGEGTVFQITPTGALTTLHSFAGFDGSNPTAKLVEAKQAPGTFYGTTYAGGEANGTVSNWGTVFSISILPGGGVAMNTLYSFCSQTNCADGARPYSGLILASDENFYGMTYVGGQGPESECLAGYFGCGTIFKITPAGALTTLHDFCSAGTFPNCTDGDLPIAALAQGSDFNFYGLAGGGTHANLGAAGTFFVLAALPVAKVSSAGLTFASQDEGTSSPSQPVTLSNTGQEALVVSNIAASGDFNQTNNCGSVAIGSSCTINVTFSPTQTGTRTGTLTITDNNAGIAGSQQAVSLTGTGANPGASLSPTTLAFGNQGIQTASSGKKVTLTSSGTTSLNNISVTVVGPNLADFSQTNTCPTTLNVGAKCTITVTFTPNLLGAESATLQVTDNTVNSPQTVALSGTGVADVTLTPISENFGNVPQETSSAAKTFTLKNNQSTGISISDIAFTGQNEGDFSQTTGGTCGTTLNAKASCNIKVTFTPSLVGAESATITVTSNALPPYNSLSSTLSGTGIAQATVSPTSITYSKQKVGTTSAAHNVTLKNNLSTALTISPSTFTGADPDDFSVSATTCGSSVAAKSSCTISVVFTPSATGTRTATLNVNDSANNSPQTVSLTGTGD